MYTFNARLSSADLGSTSDTPEVSPEASEQAFRQASQQGIAAGPLSDDLLDRMHRYWQAANYLCVGQIYLKDNPLLREPLLTAHIKPRLLGHWGTSAGQNFIYVHLNRLISEQRCEILYISGPGHGGPTLNACAWLEGSYSEVHPDITPDVHGMRALFRSFSTPGGIPSHCGPHTPNSMHEGGELGYSLVHAFGAVFDHPGLIAACVVGDGEAETCPLEGSWKSVRFLDPRRDGAVLPILHLNGYKISGPTLEARTENAALVDLYRGRGYEPIIVEGDDLPGMHQRFAAALDRCHAGIRDIQDRARRGEAPVGDAGRTDAVRWPMIILRSPKGWTGPKEVDGLPVEGTFRAHQVPLAGVNENPAHLAQLEAWMRSYAPEALFDRDGALIEPLRALTPPAKLRMGAIPYANGGRLLTALEMPEFGDYALEVPGPGRVIAEAPRKLGEFLRDIMRRNPRNFRVFGPDETNSNRLNAVFEASDRTAFGPTLPIDDHISAGGRVMEVLSEHLCEGWLEGYLLTGRHGMWSTYEAFAQVVDSMVTQHAKWLQQCREFAWRRPLASLNVLLTSHAWRNDHNGFSHQSTGFVDNVLQRRADVVRVYYPPDSNCLVNVFDHCLRSRNYVNVVTVGKQPDFQWLTFEAALEHCSRGASAWDFASSDGDGEPDVVLACAGDVPTTEAVAASWLLQKHVPGIRVRVVNVVDLGVLASPEARPHGMDHQSFEALFTQDVPVIFAYHGSTWIIHSMVHGRANEARFHVRGFADYGTTTTPFDMVVLNRMSRYHLAIDALRHVPRLRSSASDASDFFSAQLRRHDAYIREHFEDMPEIRNWRWTDDFSESDTPPPLAKGHPRAQTFSDA
ncbi:phosphoketolase family protein [Chitinasiproducens palmae]|uniref:Xylulose-5-phosphate/fructose-6-phosphate phosphoketolase n=1 Tax=Chitinasiproducens palmae TaxID=1770053 RepID=A0A1H2PM13_9BURK|nr:phosphoketolase family protein [Chitinasiproducens palmae]SDV46715.1 xylulose-5-phosphate/fructose-6-phosphate phosphoketolase [Chitinasiproducens palmae]